MMMWLGLRKDEIEIYPHDSRWLAEAEKICRQIHERAGSYLIDIQHVGSTSIPGLPAKPILDFAIGVEDMADLAGLISSLSRTR